MCARNVQVESTLKIRDAVVSRLKNSNASETHSVYVGVGGAGGARSVVVWVRLMERRGTTAAARKREQAALWVLSKMRSAFQLPVEVEGGWSLEGTHKSSVTHPR